MNWTMRGSTLNASHPRGKKPVSDSMSSQPFGLVLARRTFPKSTSLRRWSREGRLYSMTTSGRRLSPHWKASLRLPQSWAVSYVIQSGFPQICLVGPRKGGLAAESSLMKSAKDHGACLGPLTMLHQSTFLIRNNVLSVLYRGGLSRPQMLLQAAHRVLRPLTVVE